jgi:Caspase domain
MQNGGIQFANMTTLEGWKRSAERDSEQRAIASEVKRKALIVSVSDYNDTDLQELEFCKNDGLKMYEILKSLGYEIAENNSLIGKVNFNTMRNTIIKFFSNKNTKPRDTLLFYFSVYLMAQVKLISQHLK